MAILKKSELKEKSVAELTAKADELDIELAREKGSIESTGKPSNKKYHAMRQLRARLKGLLHKKATTAANAKK